MVSVTRYLYDALYPAGIPLDIEPDAIVASYIDHPEVNPPCMTQLAERFPNHVRVGISAHGHLALILDCENGAIAPADIPTLVKSSRLAGFMVAVYATVSTWSLVYQRCADESIPYPLWWEADWSGGQAIRPGTVGRQYLSAGPYDRSVITDEWASILTNQGEHPSGGGSQIPAPTPAPLPLPEDDDMWKDAALFKVGDGPASGQTFLLLPDGRYLGVQNTTEYAAYQALGAVVAAGDANGASLTNAGHRQLLAASPNYPYNNMADPAAPMPTGAH